MVDSKLPKPPMERPSIQIMRMKGAVAMFRTERAKCDQDERDFMDDLTAICRWLEHLEGEAGLQPPPKLDS